MYLIRQPEHGALMVDGVQSEALQGRASVWIYLPPGYDDSPDQRYSVLYLLHGAWGWEWDWPCKGSAAETAGRMIDSGEIEPIIMVMPNDGLRRMGTLYINWADGSGRYEDWIARDLVAHIDANLRSRADRDGRCITGLSMGGLGAANIGLRNRALFRSVATHSALFDLVEGGEHFWSEFHDQALGTHERATEYSPLRYIEDIAAEELPALYIDCGVDDFLIQANRDMHAKLESLRIPHTYSEYPGAHTWEYWTEHLVHSLRFHYGRES